MSCDTFTIFKSFTSSYVVRHPSILLSRNKKKQDFFRDLAKSVCVVARKGYDRDEGGDCICNDRGRGGIIEIY